MKRKLDMGCLPTSIVIKAPCLEGLPTKAKEAPFPHKVRLHHLTQSRMRCLHTSIFIETVSLEGLQVKAKEAPSPHLVKLLSLDTNPVFQGLSKYYLII